MPMRYTIVLSLFALICCHRSALASRLRGKTTSSTNGIKGWRRLEKTNEGKVVTNKAEEESMFYDAARKGVPEHNAVGMARGATYPEHYPDQEAMFYGGKAGEPKGRGEDSDNADNVDRASRSFFEEEVVEQEEDAPFFEEEEEEAILYEEEVGEEEEDAPRGKESESTSSGFGKMEGHPRMEHNSYEDEDISKESEAKAESNAKGNYFGEELPEELVAPPAESPLLMSYEEALVAAVPTQAPEESFVTSEVEATAAATPSPSAAETAEDMILPDTELVSFPAEADDPPQNAAEVMFGGNMVEHITTYSDHPNQQQAEPISSATTVVEAPRPQVQTLEQPPKEQEQEEEDIPHVSSNHRQQPTRDERVKRTTGILVVGAGVCALLLAFTYLVDYRRKRKQEAAQKLELNFGGSQYETDTDSSIPSNPAGLASCAASRPYAMESVHYDNNADDACEVLSDPWSFDAIATESIEFGNADFPGAGKGRISSTIDVYRKRIANYVPRRTTHTIYEEFDEGSSQTSDPIFEDDDEQEYMKTYGKNDATADVKEHLSRIYPPSPRPGEAEI